MIAFILGLVLSLGAINTLIPIFIILILLVAAAGLNRGYSLFNFFGLATLAGINPGGKASIAGKTGFGFAGAGFVGGGGGLGKKLGIGRRVKARMIKRGSRHIAATQIMKMGSRTASKDSAAQVVGGKKASAMKKAGSAVGRAVFLDKPKDTFNNIKKSKFGNAIGIQKAMDKASNVKLQARAALTPKEGTRLYNMKNPKTSKGKSLKTAAIAMGLSAIGTPMAGAAYLSMKKNNALIKKHSSKVNPKLPSSTKAKEGLTTMGHDILGIAFPPLVALKSARKAAQSYERTKDTARQRALTPGTEHSKALDAVNKYLEGKNKQSVDNLTKGEKKELRGIVNSILKSGEKSISRNIFVAAPKGISALIETGKQAKSDKKPVTSEIRRKLLENMAGMGESNSSMPTAKITKAFIDAAFVAKATKGKGILTPILDEERDAARLPLFTDRQKLGLINARAIATQSLTNDPEKLNSVNRKIDADIAATNRALAAESDPQKKDKLLKQKEALMNNKAAVFGNKNATPEMIREALNASEPASKVRNAALRNPNLSDEDRTSVLSQNLSRHGQIVESIGQLQQKISEESDRTKTEALLNDLEKKRAELSQSQAELQAIVANKKAKAEEISKVIEAVSDGGKVAAQPVSSGMRIDQFRDLVAISKQPNLNDEDRLRINDEIKKAAESMSVSRLGELYADKATSKLAETEITRRVAEGDFKKDVSEGYTAKKLAALENAEIEKASFATELKVQMADSDNISEDDLRSLLQDPNPEVRVHAQMTLAKRGITVTK